MALSVRSGAAETTTLKLALPSFCTVFQAELLAICKATRITAEILAGSAHTGLEGMSVPNIREAALKPKKHFDHESCPVSFVKRSIRIRSFGECYRRYRAGEMADVTRMFVPDAIATYGII
ncbi:unnamed protein product [Euphydryas editha]|uniref:Ribosomal protein S14 n=1 Tax=Euphydryas editha TaxID=104508 RepID=A0AAU9TFF6_EUPED|nr:unnamed protein product [Euphydryas editha]